MSTTSLEVAPDVENVLAVFREADNDDTEQGLFWYDEAHALAKRLSPDNVKRGAGVIAALSPMVKWERNMLLAERAFADGMASGCLTLNVQKANRILNGEDPLDVLSGDKVRAFYGCIADPMSTAVCIDRHAFDIAVGRVTNDRARGQLGRKGVYALFANTYIEASEIISRDGFTFSASQVQAVTWTTWRRLKRA